MRVDVRKTWAGAVIAGMLGAVSLGAIQTPQAPHHAEDGEITFLQPFSVSARRVVLALDQLGEPLSQDQRRIFDAALETNDPRDALSRATAVLDRRSRVPGPTS